MNLVDEIILQGIVEGRIKRSINNEMNGYDYTAL